MIKNIIFDLGNVLLDFKPEKFLLKFSEDKNYIRDFIFKVIESFGLKLLFKGYEICF